MEMRHFFSSTQHEQQNGVGRAKDVGQTDSPFDAEFGQLSLDLRMTEATSPDPFRRW